MEWFLFNNGFLKCSSFPYNYLLEMDKVFLYDMFKSKDDFPGILKILQDVLRTISRPQTRPAAFMLNMVIPDRWRSDNRYGIER